MPWTGPDVAGQREQFVVRATNRNQPFKELCGLFGISRTTGYRWVGRYQGLGNLRDLGERSRRPHQIPNRTPPDIELKVLDLRARVGCGARRLASLLRQQNIRLAVSTVHNILRRYKRIGTDSSNWAAWMIQVLLADDPLQQLLREFSHAVDLSQLAHLLSAGRLRERKKAMAVVASLKRIPVTVTAKCLQLHPRAVTRYFNRYGTGGTTELFRRRRAKSRDDEQDKQFLFSALHSPPSAHGINRTSRKMDDLHRILNEAGHRMSHGRIRTSTMSKDHITAALNNLNGEVWVLSMFPVAFRRFAIRMCDCRGATSCHTHETRATCHLLPGISRVPLLVGLLSASASAPAAWERFIGRKTTS